MWSLREAPHQSLPKSDLPAAYPHLWINNQIIICQYQEYMQECTQLPPCFKYLTKKCEWTAQTPHLIEWRIIKYAKRLQQTKFLSKNIHEWIPTRVLLRNSPIVESDQLCLSCKHTTETPVHLLSYMWSPHQENDLFYSLPQISTMVHSTPTWPSFLSDVVVRTKTLQPWPPPWPYHWPIPANISPNLYWPSTAQVETTFLQTIY